MKAVCVLVCFALAHSASANIFKRSHRPDTESLIEQPLDYINQYQRPLYQPQVQTYRQYIRAQKQKQQQQQQQPESASHESSQETSERFQDETQQYVAYPAAAAANAREWNTPLFSAIKKMKKDVAPTFGEIAMWRSLHMAAEPDVPVQKELQMIFAEAQKAMKHPTAVEKAQFHEAYTLAAEKNDEDAHLNATELLKKYEYPVEEHTVKTDDGYFLTLFRIPAKKQQIRDVTAKPVVFLMHGLLGSADDWLLMGPGKSLAYLLADAGYDVWLGNARGNKYSRRHASKHPAQNDFWQFSTDEVAMHDLPAMIDYALMTSGQEKLHYVGHAQGTTAFFALVAAFPVYNDKIISMHALSPMVYMTNARSPLIRLVAPTSSFEVRLRHLIGHGAFEPTKELIASVGGDMCLAEIGCKNVCSNVNFVISGISIEGVDAARAALAVAHLPAGSSVRTIKQYGQAVASGDFKKYDFGPAINSQVYGTVEPPKYNISQVTAPVTLYSAVEDWLAHPEDVARLQAELPNSEFYKVPVPHFSHMDFQFSTNATELVYKKLIDSLNNRPY